MHLVSSFVEIDGRTANFQYGAQGRRKKKKKGGRIMMEGILAGEVAGAICSCQNYVVSFAWPFRSVMCVDNLTWYRSKDRLVLNFCNFHLRFHLSFSNESRKSNNHQSAHLCNRTSVKKGYDKGVVDEDKKKETEKENVVMKDIEKNNTTLFVIQTTVAEVIFPRISNANYAKQAWDILSTEYQGNSKVRVVKLHNLCRELMNLLMKEGELIKDYYTRVMDVVNHLRICGEEMPNRRVIEKILIDLTPKYNNIVTIVEETKDLENMTVSDLIGSLEAHETWVKIEGLHVDAMESAYQMRMT
ncbi:uncharacterized protein LOC119995508 [Tripterygium wilfordii]|uniref:uncharacterized protein LOC119995508 n=1 Tax=Tripterygium wilfordii TaxID=458696 RepID=UPI0018F83CC5|nr:uncharacterized protein LOC119995508 [Tripterygium wilfordii]